MCVVDLCDRLVNQQAQGVVVTLTWICMKKMVCIEQTRMRKKGPKFVQLQWALHNNKRRFVHLRVADDFVAGSVFLRTEHVAKQRKKDAGANKR